MVEMMRKMRQFEADVRRRGVEQGDPDAENMVVHAGDAVHAMRMMVKVMDNPGR
jgi:hypothetical protein